MYTLIILLITNNSNKESNPAILCAVAAPPIVHYLLHEVGGPQSKSDDGTKEHTYSHTACPPPHPLITSTVWSTLLDPMKMTEQAMLSAAAAAI